jgi:hypothetical protein
MAETHWYPARCKMVITQELNGTRLVVHVDPSRPRAWREEPFYSDIKNWAAFAARQMHQVVVYIADRAIVIFPAADVDLGIIEADDRIVTREKRYGSYVKLEALKLKANDPRIADMPIGKTFAPRKPFDAAT